MNVSDNIRHPPPMIVVMGVAGCGKTSIGERLAVALDCHLIEGDSLHPRRNIDLMSAGVPLTDGDRAGWLAAIAERIALAAAAGEGLVVSCSALKRRYRDRLRQGSTRLVFVHLAGDKATIIERVRHRPGHFMPTSLVDSQFADLEPPGPDEAALTFDVRSPPAAIVAEALRRLPGLAARSVQPTIVQSASRPTPASGEEA